MGSDECNPGRLPATILHLSLPLRAQLWLQTPQPEERFSEKEVWCSQIWRQKSGKCYLWHHHPGAQASLVEGKNKKNDILYTWGGVSMTTWFVWLYRLRIFGSFAKCCIRKNSVCSFHVHVCSVIRRAQNHGASKLQFTSLELESTHVLHVSEWGKNLVNQKQLMFLGIPLFLWYLQH